MIFVPKICGTCAGANKAIELAYSLKDSEKNVVIYKEILHNPQVINELLKYNIKCVDNLDSLDSNTVVVIRAHGEGKSVYDYLESKKVKYYDATCVNVKRIHNIINDRYSKGYSIIIIGRKSHPEVIGSNGWCDNSAFIVQDASDLENISGINSNILIVAQTTIGEKLFKKLSKKIKEKYSSCNIECINTVCLAQKNIQKSSITVAKKCEYTFVIGGENSSNTKELFDQCSKYSKTYMFSDIKKFFSFLKEQKSFSLDDDICITGGASTPVSEINKYKNLLEFYLNYINIKSHLEKEMTVVNSSFLDANDNDIVLGAIDKFVSINCDGKYIRAFLIELGYMIKGKKKWYSDTLSLAYETFQTSILVHDDFIDNALVRRGKDTIPVTYKKHFNRLSNGNISKFGKKDDETANALAICLGDLGYYFANQMIIKKYANDKNIARVLEYYNKIVINTIKGEIIDVYLPFKEQFLDSGKVKLEDILEISKLKTSWYTIVGPFCLGIILSGASDVEVSAVEKILIPLGIAFQIKDDLLGIFSNTSVTMKDASDISEFKQTLLYYFSIKNENYRDKLLYYYGKTNLDSSDIQAVRGIFEESGAKKYAEDMMISLFDSSKKELEDSIIPQKYKNVLFGFITYLELREK